MQGGVSLAVHVVVLEAVFEVRDLRRTVTAGAEKHWPRISVDGWCNQAPVGKKAGGVETLKRESPPSPEEQ